jgi:hypothetical protein
LHLVDCFLYYIYLRYTVNQISKVVPDTHGYFLLVFIKAKNI